MFPAILVAFTTCLAPEFPRAWIGDWKGTMEWTRVGMKTEKVAMRLQVAATNKPDTYSYRLSYGEGGKDDRPYELKVVDAKVGHWQIDERNGIVLDHYWLDGTFVGVFTVSGNTIMTTERREGDVLITEMITYDGAVLSTTGGKDGVPTVTTNKIKSIQRARLRRAG